jgi:hypothetical protein
MIKIQQNRRRYAGQFSDPTKANHVGQEKQGRSSKAASYKKEIITLSRDISLADNRAQHSAEKTPEL